MAEEIWKQIKGLGDRYKISSEGRMSCRVPDGETILDPKHTGKYRRVDMVDLYSDYYEEKRIDELVAKYFLEKPKDREVKLIHINGDKSDDRAENLMWVDKDLDMRKANFPRKNYRSVSQFTKEGNRVKVFNSIAEANRVTGISYLGISLCCAHRQELSGGFRWRYTDDVESPTIELPKACPCCGGKASVCTLADLGEVTFKYVKCEKCELQTGFCKDDQTAISIWNRRFQGV